MHQLENVERRKCCSDNPNNLERQVTNSNYLHQNVQNYCHSDYPNRNDTARNIIDCFSWICLRRSRDVPKGSCV